MVQSASTIFRSLFPEAVSLADGVAAGGLSSAKGLGKAAGVADGCKPGLSAPDGKISLNKSSCKAICIAFPSEEKDDIESGRNWHSDWFRTAMYTKSQNFAQQTWFTQKKCPDHRA
jgi:hypothetical protein